MHNLGLCGLGPVVSLGLVFGGGAQLVAGNKQKPEAGNPALQFLRTTMLSVIRLCFSRTVCRLLTACRVALWGPQASSRW